MYYKACVMQGLGHGCVVSTIPGEACTAEEFRRQLANFCHGKSFQILSVERISREKFLDIQAQAKKLFDIREPLQSIPG